MRKLLRIAGGVLGCLLVAVVFLRVVGLDPYDRYPGFWMRGELETAPVTDWSFARQIEGLTGVQTHEYFLPILAHSVNTGRNYYKTGLYIVSLYPAGVLFPEGRHWNRNFVHDPRVRLKIGDKLYDRTLVKITDPVEHDKILGRSGGSLAPGFYMHIFHVVPNDQAPNDSHAKK